LDYPEKNLIVDKDIIRTNEDCAKAIKLIKSYNNKFDEEIAKVFCRIAPEYGIDPLMAIAQSILETGWFKYSGSAVSPSQYNYCGLGVTSNGITGAKFNNIEEGVRAQLQHLFAYGCKDALPADETIYDPRFKYVTRGIAPYWQNLAGRWAVPGYDKNIYAKPVDAMNANATYGQKIRAIYNQIISTEIDEYEIEKYFPKEEPEIIEPTPVEPEIVEPNPIDPVEPKEDNIWIKLLKAIAEAILKIFKNE
jgi:hypothetical protein